MKCKECSNLAFEDDKAGVNRYHCIHPEAVAGVGYRLISRTDRHEKALKTKTAPKWCPVNKRGPL